MVNNNNKQQKSIDVSHEWWKHKNQIFALFIFFLLADYETPALPEDLEHVQFEYDKISDEESLKRAREFYKIASARRTIRYFSPDPVPNEIIREIIKAAGIYIICVPL